MKADRWQQIEKLFHSALEYEPDRRTSFLAEACQGDDELQREVESLLAHETDAESLMEMPVLEMAAKAMAGISTAGVMIGSTFDRYQILDLLGKGGMGEVYRANDNKLQREVAIKILPADFSSDQDRIRRFEREALAVSALNHPNIITIYEIGNIDSTHFIVTELIDGLTLRRRMESGRMSVPEVLKIAAQISGALAAAHDAGIVHRDIKPENVMVRSDGLVKVLDFGLAKLKSERLAGDGDAGSQVDADLTGRGIVIGTVGYMSPEQVRGQAIDHRSDIFLFGVLLYEMLAGQRPFQGESAAEIMAGIANQAPAPLSGINPEISAQLELIVERCLEKKPERRFQSASDLRFALEASSAIPASRPNPPASPKIGKWSLSDNPKLAWGITTLVIVGLLATLPFVISYFQQINKTEPLSSFYKIEIPEGTSLLSLALSPDGRRLAINVRDASLNTLIYIRSLDSDKPQKLARTDGALYPFWSPDSRWIGFSAKGSLQKIEVSGGLPITICRCSPGHRGGTWNRDGLILFSPFGGPLNIVPAAGGQPSLITDMDTSGGERSHRWPQFLPDGRSFIYLVESTKHENNGIYVGSLDSSEKKLLLQTDSNAIYTLQGYLFYLKDKEVMAQAFDPRKRLLEGEPIHITTLFETVSLQKPSEMLRINRETSSMFLTFSENGRVAYYQASRINSQLVWYDRKGLRLGTLITEDDYRNPVISPDGKRVAFDGSGIMQDNNGEIWVMDVNRGIPERITYTAAVDLKPVWSPDSRRIVFGSNQGPVWQLFVKAGSGIGNAELLYTSTNNNTPFDWSLDGRFITFYEQGENTGTDVWILSLEGERKARPLLNSEFNELHAQFSPNGKWVAYGSDKAGIPQVFVRSFPADDYNTQISIEGGNFPKWRRDGRELFYMAADAKMMSVSINKIDEQFEADDPIPLFETDPPIISGPWDGIFAVAPAGDKFLIRSAAGKSGSSPVTIITNWETRLPRF